MSYKCSLYRIVEKKALARDIYSYRIECPGAAALCSPGQFVHIRAEGFTLRRPISVCEINHDHTQLRIVFLVKGEGTKAISRLNEGDFIDMIAPLGHGFTAVKPESGKSAAVIGGGIGVPPMLGLTQRLIADGTRVTAVLGFRSASNIILADEFARLGAETVICTDDGSTGIKGTVAAPLSGLLEREALGAVYACGPAPMLKAVAGLANEYGVFCEVSLEERMGCGVGACVGCVARIKRGEEEKLLRVCKEGPVFNAAEVIF